METRLLWSAGWKPLGKLALARGVSAGFTVWGGSAGAWAPWVRWQPVALAHASRKRPSSERPSVPAPKQGASSYPVQQRTPHGSQRGGERPRE